MIEWIPDYLVRSLLAGGCVAMMAGPLGSLVIWQRMAYFGDALAHASLLGITLSLFFAINVTLGVLMVALLVALILVSLQGHTWFSSDTLLGLLSHTGLALGLVCFSLLPTRVNLLSYLYGDILAVNGADVLIIAVSMVIVLAVIYKYWSNLLQMIIHPQLAQVEGVNIVRLRAIFIVLLAFVVAMGIKIVGVLLMTAMLIIPPATARCYAKSPASLAVMAAIFGMLCVGLGTSVSLFIDVPTGPVMVVCMGLGFFISLLFKHKVK